MSAEHTEDISPSISDNQTCSNVAAAGSVTIDQMVRDFILAKAIGMNGSDRVGDSIKVDQDCKEHGKSDKKKKKKKTKKKKKHKSHHKDGSSKHHRHRYRGSRDTSSKGSLSDDGCTNNMDNAEENNAVISSASEAGQVNISAESQHSEEALSHLRKEKQQHSSRQCQSRGDGSSYDKAASSRKRSPSFEAVADKHSKLTEDDKSDDVVFVKKVSARDTVRSYHSREAGEVISSDSENSDCTQQKSCRESSRSIAGVISDKRDGSKRRYGSDNSDDDPMLQHKCVKERRLAKQPSVILLSDDEADVLTEEMAEKLHKRLTTSIKKSKELQAERQLNLDSLKTGQTTTSHGTEAIEAPMCSDAACNQTDVGPTLDVSEIMLPADAGMSCGESASTSDQAASKSTALGFGKKMLKFGLKISETSAALISKGVKSSPPSGKKVCSLLHVFMFNSDEHVLYFLFEDEVLVCCM